MFRRCKPWQRRSFEEGVRIMGEEEKDPTACPHCTAELRAAEGALVCSKCGIMQPMIDSSAEWRYYGDDGSGENPARCGMPVNNLLRESSLGCIILNSGRASYEMRKIQRYTRWQSMPYPEKTLYDGYQHITTMASIAGIPKMIIDEACRYHKIISENKTFRGDNRDGIIAASIYLACRIENCPRTAKEIAHMFNLDCTSATKGCTNAMKIINEFEQGTNYGVTSPHSFIERYCTKIHLSPEMTRVAEFISLQVEKQNLIPENTPHAVAAGIVYFVSVEFELGIDKPQICQVSTISEVTIIKCYKKIDHHKKNLVPAAIYAKYKKDKDP
jgi:transcription initiation factor TFIIB